MRGWLLRSEVVSGWRRRLIARVGRTRADCGVTGRLSGNVLKRAVSSPLLENRCFTGVLRRYRCVLRAPYGALVFFF